MCGRFAMDDRVNAEITEFVTRTGRKPDEWAPNWESAFNIAPTEDIPILLDSAKTGGVAFRARPLVAGAGLVARVEAEVPHLQRPSRGHG